MNTNEKKTDLDSKKLERKNLEKAQSVFWMKRDQEIQRRFKVSSATESLLDMQYDGDYLGVFGKLMEWYKKSKTDQQKNTLSDLCLCLVRVNSYIETLRTSSKRAVAEYLTERDNNRNLLTQVCDLKKEIKTLKAEQEHYEDLDLENIDLRKKLNNELQKS